MLIGASPRCQIEKATASEALATLFDKVRYISVSTPHRCEQLMKSLRKTLGLVASALVLIAAVLGQPVLAADAAAGRTLFKQQCSVCHTAEPGDNGGAQGPSLIGVYG